MFFAFPPLVVNKITSGPKPAKKIAGKMQL